MKTLYKLMLAVCLFSAVDANAELRLFSINYDKNDLGKVYTLEIKEGEVIKSSSPYTRSTIVPYEYRSTGSLTSVEVEFERPEGKQIFNFGSIVNLMGPIVGPAKMKFSFRESLKTSQFQFIYDLQKTSTSSSGGSSSNPPSNTVVIPTDASGPVEIIMESSKDLVNWTRAEPGTYGADTPKRFFRVRAVVKE